ncbi:uncharacterized protein PGTG_01814 [Puccinia graminis f. sp. tritici CRL 75-36-700-3]|uniref:Uncharacterized protein n=1 Tax=Puccinia graminis f. sp. tritici (strain CRL 75-36-700-3 / race SCCL) TaxID=418459 RepID=E3JTE7_PUCGT|nr:uncharacterized protein PGTG_01814 [Puccinia graminis f. sp. tritici CRL 75-36-700-3]EFP75221.1 hypothetical protein PGTG_01814 [Puccinia graminis f. sp. tritici CRL 75-36-700-3]
MKRMRCVHRHRIASHRSDADIIGTHRLNLPPEPLDMRRDSGGFVVSLCPEFTQGRLRLPSHSDSSPSPTCKQRIRRNGSDSESTRTQIQFVNSIHLAWNQIDSDELPSTVVHCHQDSTSLHRYRFTAIKQSPFLNTERWRAVTTGDLIGRLVIFLSGS